MLNPEVCQHVVELAEGLWLFPGLLEPGDVIGIFPAFEHFLVDLGGMNDRHDFLLACDDFRIGHFHLHRRRTREW